MLFTIFFICMVLNVLSIATLILVGIMKLVEIYKRKNKEKEYIKVESHLMNEQEIKELFERMIKRGNNE